MSTLSHRLSIAATLILLTGAWAMPAGAQAPARVPATSTAPATTGPTAAVPDGYVIGAEDVLGVLFWREAEMSGDVTVRPDGRITLPLLGDMQAGGLTTEALKAQVQAAAQKYLTDANVTIVVRQLNSRKVFVTGEVRQPAAYPLAGPRTVMQLIAQAGGLNEYADSEHITILRTENGRPKTFKFNYKDVAKGRKVEQNISLLPGDTIVVP
jgi:polysaccharide export outer membrane protein